MIKYRIYTSGKATLFGFDIVFLTHLTDRSQLAKVQAWDVCVGGRGCCLFPIKAMLPQGSVCHCFLCLLTGAQSELRRSL